METWRKPNLESAKQASKNTRKEKSKNQERVELKRGRVQERESVREDPALPRGWELASRSNKEEGSVMQAMMFIFF